MRMLGLGDDGRLHAVQQDALVLTGTGLPPDALAHPDGTIYVRTVQGVAPTVADWMTVAFELSAGGYGPCRDGYFASTATLPTVYEPAGKKNFIISGPLMNWSLVGSPAAANRKVRGSASYWLGVVRHMLPSIDAWNNFVTSEFTAVLLHGVEAFTGSTSFASVTRNGLTSSSQTTSSGGAYTFDAMTYFDPVQGKIYHGALDSFVEVPFPEIVERYILIGGVWYPLTGARGPQGAQGVPGVQGEPGPPGPPGTTDHSALTGLGNNDHPQYVLLSDMLGWAANVVTVIPVNTVIHVSTTGNDTTGDGSETAPFATLTRAMEWLSMRRIASTAAVTVQLGAGVFAMTTITISHVDGDRITIRGQGMGDGTGNTTRIHFTSGRINVTSRMTICNMEISHASNASGVWVVAVDGNAAFLTLGVTNQNEPVRIRGGNYGVFALNQAMLRMYGGEVLDFAGRGVTADRNSFVSMFGQNYPITIDANSAGSGTVTGTVGIHAATAAMIQRVGTVNILDCATSTSADAYSTII